MKKKNMLTKISCVTLAGLIAFSGHALATNTRDSAINKLQETTGINSILADKVLGYGSNYDLRLYEYLDPQDPGGTNASWAIVATQLLELKTGTTFSAKHMDYATATNSTNEGTPNAHNRTLGSGGNRLVALGYLSSGRGLASSNALKWDGNLNKISLDTLNKINLTGRVESYVLFPSIYKMTFSALNGTFTYGFSDPFIYQAQNEDSIQKIGAYEDINVYNGGQIEENRAKVKEHIIKYGGVGASIYMNKAYCQPYDQKIEYYEGRDSDGDRYSGYTLTRTAYDDMRYYCNAKSQNTNRDVVIIGWDDEIQVKGAPGKGAYLVMDPSTVTMSYYANGNTRRWYWGNGEEWIDGKRFRVSDKKTVSTNFYYVSYYDYYIESQLYGIKDYTYMRNDKNPYQYDNLGISTVIENENSGTSTYGANVFVRNTENPESLDSIGITNLASMKYEVYVNTRNGDLNSDSLVKVAETDVLEPGYNTIYFDNTIMLTGKKFAVVVKYISPNQYESMAKIGVQSPTRKTYQINGDTTKSIIENIKYFENATSAKGRSYIGTTLDNWTDLYDNNETKNMSICIKAFTSEVPGYVIPTDSIEITKMSETGSYEKVENEFKIIKGDQAYLGINVTPSDAYNKKVNWSSSNKKVATVDKDGNLVAVGAGTATITAKLKNAPAIAKSITVDVRVPIDSFVLNKNEVTILAGDTNILAGIFGPEDATTTTISWTTSNKEVVKITDDGLLIGLKQGNAIITATVKDESGTHTATCKVNVPQSLIVDVTGVTLNKSTLTLQKGTRETLVAKVNPSDATNTAVVWTSSNKNVAIVNSNGRITALSPGTATITVTTVSGGETASCQLTVTGPQTVQPTGINISQTSLTIEKDASAQLTATVVPSNVENKTVIWNSSNLAVAEVTSNGKVTAIDTGTATITASTADGKYTAKCTVTVAKPTVRVTGVTINKTAVTLENGSTTQLIAGVTPATADNTKVTWKSDNTDVATVDDSGKVTAVGVGNATITVTTEDGNYSKTCVVYVPEKVPVTGIELSAEELTINKGRTEKLKVNVLPKNADNANYTYEISDESVIALSNTGIKGIKAGTAKITFTTEDGNYSATCTITVKDLEEDKINISSNDYDIGEDNIIKPVEPNTTVKDFKDKLETDSDVLIVIKDKDGKELTDTDLVGTGSTIEITKEIEKKVEGQDEPVKVTVKETFTIKVTGDINGDGKISSTDLSVIKQVIMGDETLDGIFKDAADLNDDGEISITDISLIKQQILNTDDGGNK